MYFKYGWKKVNHLKIVLNCSHNIQCSTEVRGCGLTKSQTCLEGLRKVTKNLSEESRSPGRYLNIEISECGAGGLTETPRRWLTWSATAVVEHEEFDTHTHRGSEDMEIHKNEILTGLLAPRMPISASF
jgi:hypothetical protein